MNIDNEQRLTVPYANESARFRVAVFDTNSKSVEIEQYYWLYRSRLQQLRPAVVKAIKETDFEEPILNNLSELDAFLVRSPRKSGQQKPSRRTVFVIGCIVKDMKLRPSVLKELASEMNALAQPVAWNDDFTSDDDRVHLEDENQQVRMLGIDAHKYCTGIVVGVRGMVLDNGDFEVTDVVFPSLEPQLPREATMPDTYVLFLSGLTFSSTSDDEDPAQLANAQLWAESLVEFTTALTENDAFDAAQIARVIVAGNLVVRHKQKYSHMEHLRRPEMRDDKAVDDLRLADRFLAQLTCHMPVDVMPGKTDPTLSMIPNTPIHKVLLPEAGRFGEMLNLVSNPYEAMINDVRVLGMSGESVAAISRMSSIDALELSLRSRHLSPLTPDLLPAWPSTTDSMIIHDTPHVYFSGNASEFASRIVRMNGAEVLLLCIPQYHKDGHAVLVNLKDLSVIEYKTDPIALSPSPDN